MAAADAMARWVRHALGEIRDGRPFTDSETGPIHTFKDLGITLPELFDLDYFRHMSWAHLASGGAGGGMRWPNRHPHSLTPGMRHAQGVMAEFARLIDWRHFASRRRLGAFVVRPQELVAYACSDEHQADHLGASRARDPRARRGPRLPAAAPGRSVEISSLGPGTYAVDFVETWNGHTLMRSDRREPGRAGSSWSCLPSATTWPSP